MLRLAAPRANSRERGLPPSAARGQGRGERKPVRLMSWGAAANRDGSRCGAVCGFAHRTHRAEDWIYNCSGSPMVPRQWLTRTPATTDHTYVGKYSYRLLSEG